MGTVRCSRRSFGELRLWGLLAPPGRPCSASCGALGRCGPGRRWRTHFWLLQAVSSSPYLGDGRGAASLRLLSVLHRDIHPMLGQRWATTIPLLLEHLDGEAQSGAAPLVLWSRFFSQSAPSLASGDQGFESWKKWPLLWFRKGPGQWG